MGVSDIKLLYSKHAGKPVQSCDRSHAKRPRRCHSLSRVVCRPANAQLVVRERDRGNPEGEPCQFRELTWRPKATVHRGDGRTGLEGTPSVLPSIDELEGIEHALLAPHTHEFNDAEITELEARHYVSDLYTHSALEHAYRQQDAKGYERSSEWRDPAHPAEQSVEEIQARLARAEAILKDRPKDYIARCERLDLRRELAKRASRAQSAERGPMSESARHGPHVACAEIPLNRAGGRWSCRWASLR